MIRIPNRHEMIKHNTQLIRTILSDPVISDIRSPIRDLTYIHVRKIFSIQASLGEDRYFKIEIVKKHHQENIKL